MEIQDFLIRYPAPPSIPRGTPKRAITVYLSEVEAKALSELAHRPELRDVYESSVSGALRHAYYYMIVQLHECINSGWRPITKQLKDTLEVHNMAATKEELFSRRDSQAAHLNMLIDYEEVDGALEEYRLLMEEVAELPQWTERIVLRAIHEHAEMQRFEGRVIARGMEWFMALREIKEKTH